MKILVLGGGGREHALAWKVAQSEGVSCVYVAPGNAGTAAEPALENVALNITDFDALAKFARQNEVALIVVGPEVPLVEGIRDYMDDAGIPCFGPSQVAAQLEGSKTFTKEFLFRHNIPTAAFETFTEVAPALDYLDKTGVPIVIKADGLAAGKGVVVAHSLEVAKSAVSDMLSGGAFGAAGNRVVIEEFLVGEEASFICLCDGVHALPFATSQDHKARDNGDQGPNTGGMGAYSPAPVVTEEVSRRIMAEVIEPTLKGMADEGASYQGFLYAGLMIAPDGSVRVIEFNCRFGDPEAQPVLMRLKSDLLQLLLRSLSGKLADVTLDWDERMALGVVMAAGGYPGKYETGMSINGLGSDFESLHTKVFHAGTKLDTTQDSQRTLTNGGRVLCVVGMGDTVAQAQKRAYDRLSTIQWQDVYYRDDIGYRAISREQS
ncbi:MAG: phosphoribosylamine--glycine ligase [Pseudomonadales bacterium]|nr:phosphoribosylamine--glycine ligase [Pseudomonadales bacterium]